MSRSFDLKINLNNEERAALRRKASVSKISMSEYIRRLVRADANDELPDFIREQNVRKVAERLREHDSVQTGQTSV